MKKVEFILSIIVYRVIGFLLLLPVLASLTRDVIFFLKYRDSYYFNILGFDRYFFETNVPILWGFMALSGVILLTRKIKP
jgi:hypothetical protein